MRCVQSTIPGEAGSLAELRHPKRVATWHPQTPAPGKLPFLPGRPT
ncbi:Uncharacterised protein [Dermacoccus nishinomiyaensis]|nr:Uncharacterised protein [Dermacoccus nishinomiyaensis]